MKRADEMLWFPRQNRTLYETASIGGKKSWYQRSVQGENALGDLSESHGNESLLSIDSGLVRPYPGLLLALYTGNSH